MQTYTIILGGKEFIIKRDVDGKFILPEELKQWENMGTALKPAFEPILVCMKPIDTTFADNALQYGLAGINIDKCRISTEEILERKLGKTTESVSGWKSTNRSEIAGKNGGRWPANIILSHHPDCVKIGEKKVKGIQTTNYGKHKTQPGANGTMRDGWKGDKIVQGYADPNGNETVEDYLCHPSCPIYLLNQQSGQSKSSGPKDIEQGPNYKNKIFGKGLGGCENSNNRRQDEGGASRFFLNLPPEAQRFLYCSKASRSERNAGCENLPEKEVQTGCGGAMPIDDKGRERDRFKKVATNIHPTCKPVKLIKYLLKLICPPQNPIILDPFAGSGTTGVACEQLNISYILMEKEEEYCDIIRARCNAANRPTKPAKRKPIIKSTNTLLNLNDDDLKERS